MNWHDPELYFFLCALVGFAALMAITYEIVSRRRKPPVILMQAMPLDGLVRDRARPSEARQVMAEIVESGPWSKSKAAVADLALSSMPDCREASQQETEQFNRLCESTKDLPLKEQASRLREHFGIFGGVRPVSRRR